MAIDVYENTFLVRKSNKKMVLLDENLKEISNEYDKISTNMMVEFFSQFE